MLCFRTLQTAVGTFGGEGYIDGVDAPPLMKAGAGDSDRPAISSLNRPPFIAVESCREHLVFFLFFTHILCIRSRTRVIENQL